MSLTRSDHRPLWAMVASTISMAIFAITNHPGAMMICAIGAMLAGAIEYSNSRIRVMEARIPARFKGR